MGRRRSGALRDIAGVYHVASRLALEGFHATCARGHGAKADVLAGLPSGSATVQVVVRTAVCSPGFGEGDEGEDRTCEWRVGKGAALADDPGLFVALVDLKRDNELPRVWVVPSVKIGGYFASLDGPGSYRYRPSAEDLAPHEHDWGAIEEHLVGKSTPQTRWFDREELAELYGEGFVEALDAEASRLLGVQNSTIVQMADERYPAEDLADASALLSVLFRRWMESKR